MEKKKHTPPADGDAIRMHTRLEGKPLARWYDLLRGEGGTQQYHTQAAIELYTAAKGYGPKPTDK